MLRGLFVVLLVLQLLLLFEESHLPVQILSLHSSSPSPSSASSHPTFSSISFSILFGDVMELDRSPTPRHSYRNPAQSETLLQ